MTLRDEPRPAPIRVLGVRVDPFTPDAIRRYIERALSTPGPLITVYSVNPEGVMLAQRDEAFASTLERGSICLSDGVGVTVAARLRGLSAPRVPGADLMVEAAGACAAAHESVFLLGAAPGVAAVAADRLRARYPTLEVESHAPPYSQTHDFEDADRDRIAARITAARPSLVCVALGQPKQERWIDANADLLADAGVRVAMAVGGAFDFLAGTQRRAPAWMRRSGLEWAWRLAREPDVRASRQARALPSFARRALGEAARRR
jgi:N-acetylglucosaminyldiphosphoundecaprenol N-acetyl-beta-D-mannosaminyltransferase